MNYRDILPPFIDSQNLSGEQIIQIIRNWRNAQLAASDWSQLPDVAFNSDKVEAWKQYRQQLRDLPSQNTDPKLIVFPTPPK